MDKAKARKEGLITLPPRHARGCPKNILRSAMWQLATCDLEPVLIAGIISSMSDILPCFCPKAAEV